MFEFNRWLFLFNLIISFLVLIFVISPLFVYDLNETERILNLNNFELSNETCNTLTNDNSNDTANMGNLTKTFDENNLNNYQSLLTKCCSLKYEKYLQNISSKNEVLDKILDAFMGRVRTFIFELQ